MKIGLYGIGNISQKAYLPVIATRMHQADWVISSRSQQKLDELKVVYGFQEGYTSLDALIDSGIDACLVQSPTHTHFAVVQKLLLSGIHVFVDKPVTDRLEDTRQLYQLAKENGCLLFVGFNRRYAPAMPFPFDNCSMIRSAKDTLPRPQDIRFVVYDLFIHPLDIVVYGLNNPDIEIDTIHSVKKGHMLHQLLVTLKHGDTIAQVSANLMAGARDELLELTTTDEKRTIRNLDQTVIRTKNQTISTSFADWDSTLYKRGFETMLTAFLTAVDTGILPESQRLTLKSHELCEAIIQHIGE